MIAISPTFVGLVALALAVPSWAAIAIGTYRILRPSLERVTGLPTDAPERSTTPSTATQLILLGLAGLLLSGALATVLLAVG